MKNNYSMAGLKTFLQTMLINKVDFINNLKLKKAMFLNMTFFVFVHFIER